METRTRAPGSNGDDIQLLHRLQTLQTIAGTVVGRANLASQLGYEFGGDRNLYQTLGYKKELGYKDFAAQYTRHDMARAVIDRPVRATWNGPLEVVESDDDKDTEFEKQFKELNKKLKLKSKFSRLDKLTGIGHYGVLLLGFSDTKNKEQLQTPLQKSGNLELMYVKPLGEEHAQIAQWQTKTSDPRYGLPLTYDVTLQDAEAGINSTIRVHWTRVIHVADGLLEGEITGTPRLEVVFNRLKDLEKLVGASAEMFWLGARPGYGGKLEDGYKLTPAEQEEIKEQINEYEHNLRRILIGKGLSLESLAQQVSDPKNHVDVQIQMIAAVTGIPKRILTGSERGELSSAQDKTEWLTYVKTRREEYAEPLIIEPFVDRLIEYGVLPTPTDDYSVKWEDLFAMGDKEKTDVGKSRAEAIAKYANAPGAEMIMPPEAFLKHCLGFNDEEVKLIMEQIDAVMEEEEKEAEERAKIEEEIRRETGQQPQPRQQQLPEEQ